MKYWVYVPYKDDVAEKLAREFTKKDKNYADYPYTLSESKRHQQIEEERKKHKKASIMLVYSKLKSGPAAELGMTPFYNSTNLREVESNDRVYIILHGNDGMKSEVQNFGFYTTNWLKVSIKADKDPISVDITKNKQPRIRTNITPEQLVDRVIEDGLPLNLPIDLRILACHGAKFPDGMVAIFARRLWGKAKCNEICVSGYTNIINSSLNEEYQLQAKNQEDPRQELLGTKNDYIAASTSRIQIPPLSVSVPDSATLFNVSGSKNKVNNKFSNCIIS